MASQEQKIRLALRTGVPLLLWGEPGIGKTKSIEGIASDMGLPCEPVIASIRDPQDFGGLPVLVKKEWILWAEGLSRAPEVPEWMRSLAKTVMEGAKHFDDGVRLEPPAWAKRLARAGKGVLFLDEITTAPPAVQAALLRVVLDRWVGDLELPRTIRIMAAANPVNLAAGGWDLSAPLANRFRHLPYAVDAEEWTKNFIPYWAKPPKLEDIQEKYWIQARSRVASYIKAQPQKLVVIPKDEAGQGGAYPTPRTWDNASRALALMMESGDAVNDSIADMITGDIGTAAAGEFIEWLRNLDLPDPEMLLANPSTFKVPRRTDLLFAILTAVSTRALAELNNERWLAAWKILGMAADAGYADIAANAAVTLRDQRKQNPLLPLPTNDLKHFVPMLKAAGFI